MMSQQPHAGTLPRSFASIMRVLAIAIIASSVSHAQWEATYGGPVCEESGRKGVAPVLVTPGGGYIVAGESHSILANCTVSNIYVTKIADNPLVFPPVWSNTYHLGTPGCSDSATCIRECVNGDFIVTGVTDNPGCASANSRDIFLMRLTAAGGVIWAQTYGTANGDLGFCVIEAKTGNGVTTFPGDFVVSGYEKDAAGIKHMLLFRTNAAGGLIWNQIYGLPPGLPAADGMLVSVDESTVGVPIGTAGDIIAAGGIQTAAFPLNIQMVLARVNGNTGLIGAAPQGIAFWGGPNADAIDEVRELKLGAQAGNIVVTGFTQTATPANEAYVAKFGPNPCNPIIAQTTIGDGTNLVDEALSISEINTGNLIVTGSSSVPGGHGGIDVFLTELTPALAIVASPPGVGYKVYGGTGTELPYSVSQVLATAGHSAGYIAAGFTQSPGLIPPGDIRQLYVIKTNNLGVSGCDRTVVPVTTAPVYVPTCYTPSIMPAIVRAPVGWTSMPQTWQTVNCWIGPETRDGGNRGNDGISGVEAPGATHRLDEASVSSAPNPVAKGETITFNYMLTKGADVSIAVTDIAGRSVATKVLRCNAGMNPIPVSTDGWASGDYVVTLAANGRSVSQKVVVTER